MIRKKCLQSFLILSVFLISAAAILAQGDVPRQTTAITYPPDETVYVPFRGTTRFPRMKGEAKIRRTNKNGTEVELTVSKMPRPFELGAGYATYVVWAISPEGQVDNLGEIKRRGFFEFDSKITVTTPLQTFAVLVTAEPHFLVRRPSRAVMLENLNPIPVKGRFVPSVTKAVQFFGNSSDYFRDPRTPEIAEADYSKTPSAVLQAQQAIALARFAGAQRDAADDLQQAETLYKNADDSWKAGRDEKQVDTTARQAISVAVKAEDTAVIRREAREKRNEKSQQDAEIQKSEDRVAEAQRQVEETKTALAGEQRARELSERDAANYNEQIKQLREENARLREELSKLRSESEDAKVSLARIEGERQAAEKQRQQEEKASRLQANIPVLMQSLRPFGTVRQTERGIILTLNESYWTSSRNYDLAAAAEPKIGGLANVLANNQGYKVAIESYTDDRGAADALQALTESRAQTIMQKLVAGGVESSRVEAKGYGANVPVAPNTTNLNRAKNRRVEVILMPSSAQ